MYLACACYFNEQQHFLWYLVSLEIRLDNADMESGD